MSHLIDRMQFTGGYMHDCARIECVKFTEFHHIKHMCDRIRIRNVQHKQQSSEKSDNKLKRCENEGEKLSTLK